MGFVAQVKNIIRELESLRFDESLSGAHVYDPARIAAGYNLCDGCLYDVNGVLIRKWRAAYLSLLLPDGRYVAQDAYESSQWGMYTWSDELLWQRELAIHHTIEFVPPDSFLTATKETRRYKGRDVDFCVLLECDLMGNELSRWSTWDHLSAIHTYHKTLTLDVPRIPFLPEGSRRKTRSPWGGFYDYYRLNSIQVLPATDLGSRDKRFQAGNILISFRHGSMIFLLDKDTREIVWSCIASDIAGGIEGQHCPQLLESGKMLIFDNGRYRGWSRVIEIDPINLVITWEYRHEGFFTCAQGYAQRLRNGNTLITESERGHVFEVTPEKEIVWEFYHPDVQDETNSCYPKNYGKRRWIYRMIRYDQIDPVIFQ